MVAVRIEGGFVDVDAETCEADGLEAMSRVNRSLACDISPRAVLILSDLFQTFFKTNTLTTIEAIFPCAFCKVLQASLHADDHPLVSLL